MAFDPDTVERVRLVLERLPLRADEATGEIRMFGGLCFTLNGKMLVGIGKGRIMVRLDSEELGAALADGNATPMDFTGKPLRNFAYLTESAAASDGDLLRWIEKSADFVRLRMGVESPRRSRQK